MRHWAERWPQPGQSAALDYSPHGLRYELQLQLSAIEAPKVLAKPEASTMLSPSHADAPNSLLSKST
jgi:hypothetical protein